MLDRESELTIGDAKRSFTPPASTDSSHSLSAVNLPLLRASLQKTGFYCDQRANRAFLRSVSRGKRVLDLCCYTGGFAISAALGGASRVTGVDSSARAIAKAEENAVLNGIGADVATFEAADISKFMARHLDQDGDHGGGQWDVVVLDPPKLCPSAKHLKPALRKYVISTLSPQLSPSLSLSMNGVRRAGKTPEKRPNDGKNS